MFSAVGYSWLYRESTKSYDEVPNFTHSRRPLYRTLWVQSIGQHPHPPGMWYRYVNDTMTKIHEYAVYYFSDHLNATNPHTQFTSEEEKNWRISFLDTCLHVNEDDFLVGKTTITSRRNVWSVNTINLFPSFLLAAYVMYFGISRCDEKIWRTLQSLSQLKLH